jgi:hypothetical protein
LPGYFVIFPGGRAAEPAQCHRPARLLEFSTRHRITHSDASMRTTVTLDPDVEVLIQAAMKERGRSFEEAVTASIRAGLAGSRRARRPFVQQALSMGAEPYFRWDKALATAGAMEDEELAHKLALRK